MAALEVWKHMWGYRAIVAVFRPNEGVDSSISGTH